MKKKIKINFKIIIAIVITAIICVSTTVYASYNYFAKDIGFTPKNENWQVDNLEDAINDLYEFNQQEKENCIKGSYVKSANNQIVIDFGFKPSTFFINASNENGQITIMYDSSINTNVKIIKHYKGTVENWNYITFNDNIISTISSTTSELYQKSQPISYYACK